MASTSVTKSKSKGKTTSKKSVIAKSVKESKSKPKASLAERRLEKTKSTLARKAFSNIEAPSINLDFEEHKELDLSDDLVDETNLMDETDEFPETPSNPFAFGGHREVSTPDPSREQMGGLDIFSYAQKYCEPKGDVPRFKVFKDGVYITLKNWPYSWERLQQEYGGGYYKIQATRGSNGQIFKTETQVIGEDPSLKKQETVMTEPKQQDGLFNNPLALFQWLENQKSKADAQRREDERLRAEKESEANKLLIAMMQAQANSQSQSTASMQTMIIEMQKNNYEQLKALQDGLGKVFESLSRRIDDASSKKDTFGTMELLKLLEDREERGWKKSQEMMEFIDAKVEIAKSGSDDEEPKEKEGIMEAAVRTILPILSQTAMGQQQTQVPEGLMVPNQIPPGRMVRGVDPTAPITSAAAPQREVRPPQAPPTRQSPPNRPMGGSAPQKADLSVKGPAIAPQNVQVIGKSANIPVDAANPTSETVDVAKVRGNEARLEGSILSVAVPLIADGLINQAAPAQSARLTLSELEKRGIGLPDVLRVWSEAKLIKTARDMGVPDIADPWLKEFWNVIKATQPGGNTRPNQPVAN